MTKTSKKPEVTSSHMATLAAKTLINPNATELEKKLAGALLTQAPDKPKNKAAK